MEKKITEELAAFVTDCEFDWLPAQVVEITRRHILDCSGVALAGSASEPGRIVGSLCPPTLGPSASIIGVPEKTTLVNAAWANCTFAHLLDFDDTGFSHPTACIFPAALAVCEAEHGNGGDLITSMVVGYEVFERIAAAGRELEPALRARGFHPTALYGCAAAAAAASHLLRLSVKQVAIAIGLALSNAGGLTEQVGTWAKGIQAGNAGRAGVVSALLAARGYWGSTEILEGRHGFFQAIYDGNVDLDGIVRNLGETWALLEPGLNIKPYPACGRTLRAIDAALELRTEHAIDPADISTITIYAYPDYIHTLPYEKPWIGFHGKFSLDYCVAAALLDGDVNLKSFSDEYARQPSLRDLLEKVEVEVRADWPPERRRDNPITIELSNGRQHTASVQNARGSVARPLSPHELRMKFRQCASLAGLSELEQESFIETAERLDESVSASDLTAVLTT